MTDCQLLIVVIFYNILREAERKLYTLSANYQADLSHESYEVIAIDNASRYLLNADQVRQFGPNFYYDFFETASASPASAINYGARLAKGKNIAVIVDGARTVSPRLVRTTLLGCVPGRGVRAACFRRSDPVWVHRFIEPRSGSGFDQDGRSGPRFPASCIFGRRPTRRSARAGWRRPGG